MSALEKLNLDRKKFLINKLSFSDTQEQTKNTFGYKWKKRDTYESTDLLNNTKNWLFEKYFDNDEKLLDDLLGDGGKIILDAGCGSGFSALLLFGEHLNDNDYLGVDISESVFIAEERFKEKKIKGDFIKSDLMNIEIPDNSVDIIFSEGVLHHTDNTYKAIKSLSKKLKPGGTFMFYVYARKSVIREFTDDYIREKLKKYDDETAWEILKPLSQLGIALGEIDQNIEIENDIELLGIKKGEYNLQRFFFYNIMKVFYRSEYSIEEINHINFDWFRPLNCHRHSKEEVIQYCIDSDLIIEKIKVEDSGITVIAKK